MSNNEKYFKTFCEVMQCVFEHKDCDNPAIKSIIRFLVREASNMCTELPGYDNKLGAELVSTEARKQIQSGDTSKLIGEHVIPVSIINKTLMNSKDKSLEKIEKTIKALSKRAVITKDEDAKLRKKGLSKKMPEGWEWNGNNIMARYDAVKIVTEEITYKEVIKKYNQ